MGLGEFRRAPRRHATRSTICTQALRENVERRSTDPRPRQVELRLELARAAPPRSSPPYQVGRDRFARRPQDMSRKRGGP